MVQLTKEDFKNNCYKYVKESMVLSNCDAGEDY